MSVRIFAALGLMALLVVSASAQPALRATIPFDFAVGATRMAAGEYVVTAVTPAIVRIAPADGPGGCVALTNATGGGKPAVGSKLVFNRYGNAHFLSQVWRDGYDQARELFKSKAELEYASNGSGARLASIHVTLR